MNKPPGKLENSSGEDDFTSSMARLAELAAKNIETDEKKREKDRAAKDDEFREFMTPKKKAVEKAGWSQKLFGGRIKVRINPYVASGFLIILISAGFICAPRISKYFAERTAELERKKASAAQVASQTDASLKNYTVFDAAKDVSNNDGELKTASISELAKQVSEANAKFGNKLEVSWNFGNFDLAPESKGDNEQGLLPEATTENSSGLDSNTPVEGEAALVDTDSEPPLDWANSDLSTNPTPDFIWEEQCTDPNTLFQEGGEEVIIRDVLLQIGAIGGTKVTTQACS